MTRPGSGERRAVDRQILALALPAVAALAAEPLYELTDTAVLGHLGTATLAGATIATNILLLCSSVFIFLMFGTTANVARLHGAGRHDDATIQGIQGMWLGAIAGLVVAAVAFPFGPALISTWGGHGESAVAAQTYFSISLAGFPAFLMVMAGTGYLRGGGDTRIPLAIALSTVILNLVGELVAIYVLGFGVGASALTTVGAKWIAAAAYLALLRRDARRRQVSPWPQRRALRQLSATGWPIVVRTAALRATVSGSVAVAGSLGSVSVAAYGVAFGIWSFLAFLADGFEVAGQVLIGRALGSDDERGARLVGRRILRMALLLGVGAGLAVALASGALPHLFTSDEAVLSAAAMSLLWVAVLQPVNAVTFSLDGILLGAGDLAFLAWAMIGAAVLVAPFGAVIVWRHGPLWTVWAAMAFFMMVRMLSLATRFRGHRWVNLGLGAFAAPT